MPVSIAHHLLSDPYLEVYDAKSEIIARNDNWKEQQTSSDPDPSSTLENGSYVDYTSNTRW